jgi:site-specific recombinase XerD
MPRDRAMPYGQETADLIDEFCVQADVAASTHAKYRSHLGELATWLQHPRARASGEGKHTLLTATAHDLVRFLAYLTTDERFAATADAARAGALSAGTRRNVLASIKSLYRYLLLVGLVDHDPSAGIRAPKVRHSPGFCLDPDELEQLLSASGHSRERIQTFLLVYTAARVSELCNLTWDDVDFHARTLLLNGKNDKPHTVDIHPRLMSELRLWYINQQHTAQHSPALAAALAHSDTAFVLLSRTGRRLTPSAISKQLKRRAARAGIHALEPRHGEHRSRVSPHAIRRSVATALLNSGFALDAVADVLNHAQTDTTRRHYAFASNERRRATIEGILR